MIPYSYNWVNMRGIDLATISETDMDGIYSEIVEASNLCGDVVLYNWKFAEIEIPPQHTHIIIGNPLIINGSVYISSSDEIIVPGLIPPVGPLSITENGLYVASDYDLYGFDEVDVSTSAVSENVKTYVRTIAPKYSGGYEYANYVYRTTFATNCGLVLLADASQGANSVQLTQSITDFSGVVLQGIYNGQRTSGFNTTLMYLNPSLSVGYWAGMKDRNSSYTCYVNFTSNTTATLSGNKQVIIYGIP